MVKAESKIHIEKVISQFKNGQMIIVVDDEDRENEGDFIFAAEKATPLDLNFSSAFMLLLTFFYISFYYFLY